MHVELWVDVRCPFARLAAEWIVEDVAAERELEVTWRPMSLFFVHQPEPGDPGYDKLRFTHGLLRVITAVAASEPQQAVGRLYLEMATRVWRDRDWGFDPSEALTAVDLNPDYAAAATEESWDDEIRESMAAAYGLIGSGVGNTPVIAIEDDQGKLHGMYGPELVRRPRPERSLALWDSLVESVTNDALATLGRQTPDIPDFGPRG